jgi:hypothetical protein
MAAASLVAWALSMVTLAYPAFNESNAMGG